MSATHGTDGTVRIDASELLRVYPDADLKRSVPGAGNVTRNDPNGGERAALQVLIDELRGDKGRLQAELDRAYEERVRLLALLERQTEQVRLLTDERRPAGDTDEAEGEVVAATEAEALTVRERPSRWWRWLLFMVV